MAKEHIIKNQEEMIYVRASTTTGGFEIYYNGKWYEATKGTMKIIKDKVYENMAVKPATRQTAPQLG